MAIQPTLLEADADPGVGLLHDLIGYHLRRAAGVFATDFTRALAGTGIRQVLFGLLSVLHANPGINQGLAGRYLGIQRANMVSLITELVEAGLVDRRISAEDRRAFSLSLTTAGEAMFDRCTALIRAHEEQLLSDFTAAERRTLIRLLSRIEAREG
jgi:DNA-binding MarR family transcriptional regulator